VDGSGGTEGRGRGCKCGWEWGNRGKREGVVNVGGSGVKEEKKSEEIQDLGKMGWWCNSLL
jgi:hypothetical protein